MAVRNTAGRASAALGNNIREFLCGFHTVELSIIGIHMHALIVLYLWFLFEEN